MLAGSLNSQDVNFVKIWLMSESEVPPVKRGEDVLSMSKQIPDLKKKLTDSMDRGAAWLSSAVEEEGRFEQCPFDLAGYYKPIALFATAGRWDHGARCLNFMKENLVNEKNQLCHQGRKTELGCMQRNLSNYMDAWVALGSWMLGDYRFSEMICRNLIKQQNSLTGGGLKPVRWCTQSGKGTTWPQRPAAAGHF